jgi:cAMP phosphodiesterase
MNLTILKFKRNFLFLFALLMFGSCDYLLSHSGHVIDSSKMPVEKVKVQLLFGKDKNDTIDVLDRYINNKLIRGPLFTDTNGYFIFGKLVGRKPNYLLRFTKKGYDDYILNSDSIIIMNDSNLIINLKKKDTNFLSRLKTPD